MFHINMNLGGELSELILIPFCPYTRFIPNIYPLFFSAVRSDTGAGGPDMLATYDSLW